MRRAAIILALVAPLLLASVALAQSGSNYDLSWWTVDGGGATFNTGGGYAPGSTTGQPDAAIWSGGGYTLTGGFWGGVGPIEYRIHMPVVMRQYQP